MENNEYYRESLAQIEREILTKLIEPHVRSNAWEFEYMYLAKDGDVMDRIVAYIADSIRFSATLATVRVINEFEEPDALPRSTNCSADLPDRTSTPRRHRGRILPCLTVVKRPGGTRVFFWQRGASTEPDQVGEELFSMDKDGWPKGGILAQYFSVRVLLAAALQGAQSGVTIDEFAGQFVSELRDAFELFCDNRRVAGLSSFSPTREYYRNVSGLEENCSDAMYRIFETWQAVSILEDLSIKEMASMRWESTPFISTEERRKEDESRLQSTGYWRLWDAWNPSENATIQPYSKDTYVAVSHVWDGVSDDRLRDEILWHSRATKNRYYWVDKWCIKQMSDGSKTQPNEDRRQAEKEKSYMIPLMGMIYEGATVVLICHDGNFRAELPVDIQPELLYETELPGDKKPKNLQKAIYSMKESWEMLRWHRRMWTFQEGVLGKRYETMLGGLSGPLDLQKAGLGLRPQQNAQWTKRSGRRGSVTNPFIRGDLIRIPEEGPATLEIADYSEDFRCSVDPDRRRRPLGLLMSEVSGRSCNREEDTLYALWAVALEHLPRPVPRKKRRDIIQSLTTIGAFGMEVLVGPIYEDIMTRCWVPEHPRYCDPWTTPKASALVPAFLDGAWVAIGGLTLQPSRFPKRPYNHKKTHNDVMMELGTALQPGDRIVLGETYNSLLRLDAEDGGKREEGWCFYWVAVDQSRGHLLKVERFDL